VPSARAAPETGGQETGKAARNYHCWVPVARCGGT
jgi:hypothetical protein